MKLWINGPARKGFLGFLQRTVFEGQRILDEFADDMCSGNMSFLDSGGVLAGHPKAMVGHCQERASAGSGERDGTYVHVVCRLKGTHDIL